VDDRIAGALCSSCPSTTSARNSLSSTGSFDDTLIIWFIGINAANGGLNIIARVGAAVEERQHDLSFLIFAAGLCAYVYARVSGGQAEAPPPEEAIVSGHKYQIGQSYLSSERASGIYQITQLWPPEGEAFQYRIKNVNEPHERVAKENELRSA
jgi:hypothetical protein